MRDYQMIKLFASSHRNTNLTFAVNRATLQLLDGAQLQATQDIAGLCRKGTSCHIVKAVDDHQYGVTMLTLQGSNKQYQIELFAYELAQYFVLVGDQLQDTFIEEQPAPKQNGFGNSGDPIDWSAKSMNRKHVHVCVN